MRQIKCVFPWLFSLVLFCVESFALVEGRLGKLDASATFKASYDSRVFAMPSSDFQNIQNSDNSAGITTSDLKSEDDFILSFSPALHYTNKFGLLKLSGSLGANITQYVINDSKSFIVPTTSLSIDFDDTLALKKRLSNNAKIRFESTFDVGQVVGASILDQDLVSYTYVSGGFNVRYNHSEKFGLGGGTSYSQRFYQTEASDPDAPNFDFSTLPLSARAFYIYSEKLDFFTNYTYSRSKASSTGAELTSSRSHSISIGADGEFSSKLSGSASIGYSLMDFDNEFTSNQHNIITSLALNWKYNSKTSSSYSISRSFTPTSSGQSTFSTNFRAGLNHRFTEDWSGGGYLSLGFTDYTTATDPSPTSSNSTTNEYSMQTYGLGFNLNKKLSPIFTASGGYDYTLTNSDTSSSGSYGRHVIHGQVTGRF